MVCGSVPTGSRLVVCERQVAVKRVLLLWRNWRNPKTYTRNHVNTAIQDWLPQFDKAKPK